MWFLILGAAAIAYWLYEHGKVPPAGVGAITQGGITYYGILDQSAAVSPDTGETVWIHHKLADGTDENVQLAVIGPMAGGLWALSDIDSFNSRMPPSEGPTLPRTHFAIMPQA